jgi:hypothetical protein
MRTASVTSTATLAERWRADAKVLRQYGATSQADDLEARATELEEFERERTLEALTLEQAAMESGYTYSALEKMVRRGELENIGKKGQPRLRRGDLPRKARAPSRRLSGGPELAAEVLRRRVAPAPLARQVGASHHV